MDALELLKSDHDRVKSLFGQFQNERGRQQQILLFENMRNDLEAHSQVEEQVFYPAFLKYAEFKGILEESAREHAKVKEMLKRIGALSDDSPELGSQVEQLITAVNKHIEEEETELFAMVRKIMRRPERERLGRHMQAAKEESSGIAA